MRIAVAGATGNIGARTVAALEKDGHEAVHISRSLGVDLITGRGLDTALEEVDAVVDAISSPPISPDETRAYFGTATRNLLAAEEHAGVRHHVLLSIVGIDRTVGGTAHYAGKREQERLIEAGRVPWTIVPATQFHDFAALAASWTERDGVAAIAPLLVQPIAPDDIAEILAELAAGPPQGRYVDVAGPEPQDLVDMARRTLDVLGRKVRLVPTWSGPLDESMAGDVLLPGANARIAPTTFDDWLAAGAGQTKTGQAATHSEGMVIVTETGSGTYTQQIVAGHHQLVADEPRPVGDDAGPTPDDLILAGLGSCTSMTIRMYADRKGWPLERVRVTLRHSRIHARDCADCETKTGFVEHIDRAIELFGGLDGDQLQRLLHIAERCPVHQTLTSEVHISTSLGDG